MSSTHFDAFFDETQAREYVLATGHSHPWNGKLLAKEGNSVVERDILSARDYMSAGSVDRTTQTIDHISKLWKFQQLFPFMQSYTIEPVLPGQSGSLQLQIDSRKPFLLWGAKLQPTFFDGQLLTETNLACFAEAMRMAVPGFKHSGDEKCEGHFMHSMCCTSFVPNVFAASAVGYNHNELVKFEAVSPFILLVDHARETMLAVPFSLERATIGNSMMIAPLIFHMDSSGYTRWYVPPTCPTDGVVNTGEYSSNFRRQMCALTSAFEDDFASFQRLERAVTPLHPTPTPLLGRTLDLPSLRRVVFVQNGVASIGEDTAACEDRVFVHFGLTLRLADTFTPTPAADVVLPILSGVAHGHSSLSLGSRADCATFGSSNQWRDAVNSAASIIVHANDGPEWYENGLQAMVDRVVGLMVVYISTNLPTNAKSRLVQLSEKKLCCVRLMSGLSIVVVRAPNGEAFFYRGATGVLPIAPENPSFGDSIDLHTTIAMHSSRQAPLVVKSFVDKDAKTIMMSNGAMIEPTALHIITELVVNGGNEWCNVVAQLSVCLSSAEIDAYKATLKKMILDLEEDETKTAKAHLQTLVSNLKAALRGVPAEEDVALHTEPERKLVMEQKSAIRDMQRPYREALGRVEQLCSFKIVSARNVGVQQAQRKMAVTANVLRATNLSASQLAEKLLLSTSGFAVARIDAEAALVFLQHISKGEIDKFLQTLANPMRVLTCSVADEARLDIAGCFERKHAGFLMAPNCTILDVDSVEMLLEHTHADHILTSTKKQLTFLMQGAPHLVLPLFEDARNLDGRYIDFMNEANDEAKADFRVTLRNMLSTLKHRIPIRPSSPDLTFGIMVIVLSLMMSIVRPLDATTVDPSSTVCETLRGLMYLWGTFAGSGQKPVTFAFQLTQPGAKIQQPKLRGEWTIYAMVAHIYPFLKLPSAAFKSNVRTLLVNALYRALVAPIAHEMQAEATAATKAALAKRMQCRQIALRWNFAACAILTRVDKKEIDVEAGKAVAASLIERMPDAPTFTTAQLKKTLDLLVSNEAQIDWDIVRRCIACAVVKRSACFAAHKKAKTVAALVRAKVTMCNKVNMARPGDLILCDIPFGACELEDKLFCGTMNVSGKKQFIYKDTSKPATILVQNEQAYVDGDVAKMKGDAELKRVPWRIEAPPIDDGLSNSDFLRRIMPTLVPFVSAEASATIATNEAVPDHVACTPALLRLWEEATKLDNSKLDQIMPGSCLRTLFAAVGVDASDQAIAIGTLVRMFLSDMKHVEAQTQEAIKYLKRHYDTPTASSGPVELA